MARFELSNDTSPSDRHGDELVYVCMYVYTLAAARKWRISIIKRGEQCTVCQGPIRASCARVRVIRCSDASAILQRAHARAVVPLAPRAYVRYGGCSARKCSGGRRVHVTCIRPRFSHRDIISIQREREREAKLSLTIFPSRKIGFARKSGCFTGTRGSRVSDTGWSNFLG